MIGVVILVSSLAAGTISGTIHDSTGGVVPGASITVRESGNEQRTVSGADGRFTVDTPANGEVVLIVRAQGFAEKEQRSPVGSQDVDIVLAPASLLENVTVTASRTEQRLGDV